MCDKRIVRGNTYASMIVSTTDPSNVQKRTLKQPAITKATADQSNEKREISTPEPGEGRKNADIKTDVRVEEITDKPPQYEMALQTDFYIDRPSTPHFIPKKTGIDQEAQVEQGELFDFDEEVEPLLNALCSKIQEQSMMEVIEEEELKMIKEERSQYLKLREKELTEAQKQELQEVRKLEEIERRKKQTNANKEVFSFTHKRLYARSIAKAYLFTLRDNTLNNLEQQGVFRDTTDYQILSTIMPALYGEVRKINDSEAAFQSIICEILGEASMGHVNLHKKKLLERESIFTERKNKVEAEKIRKDEARKKKKEEKEVLHKKEEFAKFKENIETEFVKGGQIVSESTLNTQTLTSANGYFMKKPIVASVGGIIIEIISILSDIIQTKGSSDFLNEKTIMMFIGTYLTKEMKCEGFPLFIGTPLLQYLKAHNLTLYQLNEPEGAAMVN